MSQVDLLLPQPTLSPCELRKSPDCDSYVDRNGMPPSGSLENHDDKQAEPKPGVSKHNGELPAQGRKKRHRRGKKRKWRPYSKLSWAERKDLQDREAKKAEKMRADMCACGLTLAPYNTTQFLMEDRNLKEPDYEHIPAGQHRHRTNSHNSNDSSEEYYSSPEDEEDFLQQQFTETYKNFHAERLSSMTKGELVQELMSVEDRLEALQTQLQSVESEAKARTEPPPVENHEEQMEKIRVFEEEILKLSQENERLKKENEDLRLRLIY